MDWHFNIFSLILFLCSIATAWVGVYAWRQRALVGVGPALTLLGTLLWSLGYAVALGVHDLPGRIFWAKIQHLGIALTPVAMAVFVLQYIGREKWLSLRNLVLLAAVPLMGMILAWTNEAHGLIWKRLDLRIVNSIVLLDISYGLYFWIYFAYNYLILLSSAIIFMRVALQAPYLQRRQAIIMLTGTLCPGVALVIYLTGIGPLPYLDLTPLGYGLGSLILVWGLFRYRLFNIVPVARNKVIENMTDGVIVLDLQGRIMDANPSFLQLSGYSSKEIVGQLFGKILGGNLDLERINHETQAQIAIGKGKEERHFQVLISPLYQRHQILAGRVAVLRDITTSKQAAEEREKLIGDLQIALSKVKVLSGLLPICSSCKRIRDDKGSWNQIEAYIGKHSEVEFTHGICPECSKKLYPEIYSEQ